MQKSEVASDFEGFINPQYTGDRPWWFPASFDPTDWCACGVFSIHHALVFLGQGENSRCLKNLHTSSWDLLKEGIELGPLCRVIRKTGCRAEPKVHSQRKGLHQFVDAHLKAGHPVILGSETEEHWICLGGRTSDGCYVQADSAEPRAIAAYSWESLADWTGIDGVEIETVAVLPGKGMPASRTAVPHMYGIWKIWHDHPEYAENWGNLLADMLDVFWDSSLAPGGIPADQFFDEHGARIAEATAEFCGLPLKTAQSQLDDYRNAADFHSLVVPKDELSGAITRLGFVLQARLEEEF